MTQHAVHSDPEILGGTPVFVGTRVPFHALIDYLEDGYTIEVAAPAEGGQRSGRSRRGRVTEE